MSKSAFKLAQVAVLLCFAAVVHGRMLPRSHSPCPAGICPARAPLLAQKKHAAHFCPHPTAKGKVLFPNSIIGRGKVNYDMYSGYVNVTAAPDYLFYWFFSSRDKDPKAPLIVWTNGGPGCSSMEGATTENGPLTLLNMQEACSTVGNCDYTGQFSGNPYGWNAHANLLYLDQPRNVGNRYRSIYLS
jgi:carboxypeptidase C (cathepsin A)